MSATVKLYAFAASRWLRACIFSSSLTGNLEKNLQNKSARLKKINISPYLDSFDRLLYQLDEKLDREIGDLQFLEIGTGQNLCIPIMLKMAGARRVVTVDIDNLVVDEIVRQSVNAIADSREYRDILARHGLQIREFKADSLGSVTTQHYLEAFDIVYIDDVDLTRKEDVERIGDSQFDLIYSNDVMEHIGQPVQYAIFERLTSTFFEQALHVHIIDLTDHFSHAIPSLHKKNHLSFKEWHWQLLSGNRYMCQNRLSISDYRALADRFLQEPTVTVLDEQTASEMQQIRISEDLPDSDADYSANRIELVGFA